MRRKASEEPILSIGDWSGTVRDLTNIGSGFIERLCGSISSLSDVRRLIPHYPELARYGQGCRILTRMALVSRNSTESRMMDNLREMYAGSLIRSYEGVRMVETALDADLSYNNMQMIVIRLLESIGSGDMHRLRPLSLRFCRYLTAKDQPERRCRMITAVGARAFDLIRDHVLCRLLVVHLLEASGDDFYRVVKRLVDIRTGNCPELLTLLVDEDEEVVTRAYRVLRYVLVGMRRTWIPYARQVVDTLRPYLHGIRGLTELL